MRVCGRRDTRHIAAAASAETPSQNAPRAPTLWDGLESRVPQRRGWASAEPRSISRAALLRTCLPCVREVCRVRAEPQNRASTRHVRRRDLRPGHGVLHQAEQRRDGPQGTIGSSMPRVIQRSATNSPSTPADRNGRRPQKGRRSRRNAGKPAVSLRSTTAPADQNREAPTRRCRRSTDQREPPLTTRANARSVPASSARTERVRIG